MTAQDGADCSSGDRDRMRHEDWRNVMSAGLECRAVTASIGSCGHYEAARPSSLRRSVLSGPSLLCAAHSVACPQINCRTVETQWQSGVRAVKVQGPAGSSRVQQGGRSYWAPGEGCAVLVPGTGTIYATCLDGRGGGLGHSGAGDGRLHNRY